MPAVTAAGTASLAGLLAMTVLASAYTSGSAWATTP